MNKTKEIEVWIHQSDIVKLENKLSGSSWVTEVKPENRTDFLKARLIIDLPERKVEITESEFDEAVERIPSGLSYNGMFSHLREKIFGKAES